jgi:WD40 repeat protein
VYLLIFLRAITRKRLPALFLLLTWWFWAGIGSVTGSPPGPNEYAAPSDLMTFAASPNGKWIAAFAADGTLLLWDTEGWHRRAPISNYKVSLGADGLAFSPDSSRLAVGDANGLIQIFDASAGTVVSKMQDKDWVEQFSFSGDGTRLATWNHKGITVWDIGADKELRFFPEKSRITAIALNHDGSLLITGTEDSKIQIWDIERDENRAVLALEPHDWTNFVALDEQRRLLFSAQGQNDIGVWDLTTGRKLRTLAGHTDQVLWLKLLPEKHTVLSVDDDGTLKAWDYLTGVLRSNWKVSPGFVTDRGDWLVSGDPKARNRIQVWQIASRRLLKTLTYDSPHERK